MKFALQQYLDTAVTSIHGAIQIEMMLKEGGFQELSDSSAQQPVVQRREGSVVAIRPGSVPPEEGGLLILAAHTDSPGMQLKHRSAVVEDHFLRVPVEVYGSPVIATWLDQDLTIAGRVATAREVYRIFIPRPMGIIPNVAIHLDRTKNDSLTYHRQDQLPVLFGPDAQMDDQWLLQRVAEHLEISPAEIIDMELNVVPLSPATVMDTGMLTSPRIDNASGCFAVLQAIRAQPIHREQTVVAMFYDHEEIGSTTAFGATGSGLPQFLRRYYHRHQPDTLLEDILDRAVLVSVDAANGRHPNYRGLHDSGYAPLLGAGPVIKKSAIRRYASELPAVAWFAATAAGVDVPVQYLQNRSDIPAGTTIGPIAASQLAIPSVDVGIPILAMHSSRETATVQDVEQLTQVLQNLSIGVFHDIRDPDTTRKN